MLFDIQKEKPNYEIPINKVGNKGMRIPIKIKTKDNNIINTIADMDMFVNLQNDQKGTHMSRFIEIIEKYIKGIDIASSDLVIIEKMMLKKLEAERAFIALKFPYFIIKKSPVSKKESGYYVDIIMEQSNGYFSLTVKAVGTSLCPCSKEISKYGAHNQRSRISVIIKYKNDGENIIWIEDILKDIIEPTFSCPIYELLKREDEKFVTEKAYENPGFVEDQIRFMSNKLKNYNDNIVYYKLTVTNEESIHQHNAYAEIEKYRKTY